MWGLHPQGGHIGKGVQGVGVAPGGCGFFSCKHRGRCGNLGSFTHPGFRPRGDCPCRATGREGLIAIKIKIC